MEIKSINKHTSFNGFFNNKLLLNTLEYAGDNAALFSAGTAVGFSVLVRPLAILSAPAAKKDDKKYACAKSIASSIIGLGVMYGISKPITDSINNIQVKPTDFLKNDTITFLKDTNNTIANSKKFIFSKKMFNLTAAVFSTVPKAFLTCALIPPLMKFIFHENPVKAPKSSISFTGKTNKSLYDIFSNQLSVGMGKLMNKSNFQEFINKFHNKNYTQHMFNISDVMATGLFAKYTINNKHIKADRKKTLIANASIMTAISVIGGYCVNSLLNKPTEYIIKNLSKANATSPKLEKYISGVKTVKPALILSGLYYLLAPIVATSLAGIFFDKGKS